MCNTLLTYPLLYTLLSVLNPLHQLLLRLAERYQEDSRSSKNLEFVDELEAMTVDQEKDTLSSDQLEGRPNESDTLKQASPSQYTGRLFADNLSGLPPQSSSSLPSSSLDQPSKSSEMDTTILVRALKGMNLNRVSFKTPSYPPLHPCLSGAAGGDAGSTQPPPNQTLPSAWIKRPLALMPGLAAAETPAFKELGKVQSKKPKGGKNRMKQREDTTKGAETNGEPFVRYIQRMITVLGVDETTLNDGEGREQSSERKDRADTSSSSSISSSTEHGSKGKVKDRTNSGSKAIHSISEDSQGLEMSQDLLDTIHPGSGRKKDEEAKEQVIQEKRQRGKDDVKEEDKIRRKRVWCEEEEGGGEEEEEKGKGSENHVHEEMEAEYSLPTRKKRRVNG